MLFNYTKICQLQKEEAFQKQLKQTLPTIINRVTKDIGQILQFEKLFKDAKPNSVQELSFQSHLRLDPPIARQQPQLDEPIQNINELIRQYFQQEKEKLQELALLEIEENWKNYKQVKRVYKYKKDRQNQNNKKVWKQRNRMWKKNVMQQKRNIRDKFKHQIVINVFVEINYIINKQQNVFYVKNIIMQIVQIKVMMKDMLKILHVQDVLYIIWINIVKSFQLLQNHFHLKKKQVQQVQKQLILNQNPIKLIQDVLEWIVLYQQKKLHSQNIGELHINNNKKVAEFIPLAQQSYQHKCKDEKLIFTIPQNEECTLMIKEIISGMEQKKNIEFKVNNYIILLYIKLNSILQNNLQKRLFNLIKIVLVQNKLQILLYFKQIIYHLLILNKLSKLFLYCVVQVLLQLLLLQVESIVIIYNVSHLKIIQ
ncbi:unnamed protein product [Paramecium sonneborni]|uniref:Uncharacterized protein n=1 Tax=Paramecium sonneborni TaxID=65129 RepID=A0A8S1RQ29_9CILI|nr:unnamed protein product [Paramecium sonneborni]